MPTGPKKEEEDMCAQLPSEIKQQHPSDKMVCEDLENLKSDTIELNEMLKSAKRQSVKEVILSDINLLAAKIESLKESVSVQAKTEMQWSDVAGRRKTFSYTRQIKSHFYFYYIFIIIY
jgi:hypothetical protein